MHVGVLIYTRNVQSTFLRSKARDLEIFQYFFSEIALQLVIKRGLQGALSYTIQPAIYLFLISNEIVNDLNTMSFPIKVNSNTIELTGHTSCYCVLD